VFVSVVGQDPDEVSVRLAELNLYVQLPLLTEPIKGGLASSLNVGSRPT
jgi:hypothetical protein